MYLYTILTVLTSWHPLSSQVVTRRRGPRRSPLRHKTISLYSCSILWEGGVPTRHLKHLFHIDA